MSPESWMWCLPHLPPFGGKYPLVASRTLCLLSDLRLDSLEYGIPFWNLFSLVLCWEVSCHSWSLYSTSFFHLGTSGVLLASLSVGYAGPLVHVPSQEAEVVLEGIVDAVRRSCVECDMLTPCCPHMFPCRCISLAEFP